MPQINDRLGGDETLLNLLYDFLDREPPLNPLLASFFSKTIGNLIARKTEQVIHAQGLGWRLAGAASCRLPSLAVGSRILGEVSAGQLWNRPPCSVPGSVQGPNEASPSCH